jgi:hypothetical protein
MLVVNLLIFILFLTLYLLDLQAGKLFGSFQLSVPLGLVFMIMFTMTGALLKAGRFYLYGFLVLGSFIFWEYLFTRGLAVHHGLPGGAFSSGGIIVMTGAIYLYRFVKTYRIDNEYN